MTEAIPASEELISICLAAVRQLGPGAENPDGLSDSCREVLRWVANRFDRPLDLPEPRDPMLPAMVDATLRQCAALHELDLDGLDFYREEWPYEESGPGVVTPQCLCDLLEAMLADSAGTLRGGLGAYYTPFREVELLCRLLLLAQLSSRLGHIPGATETVRRILFPGELEAPSNARALLLDPMNLELYREVDDAIAETSWCDPACGGGNFLVTVAILLKSLQGPLLDEVFDWVARQPPGSIAPERYPDLSPPRLPLLCGMDRMPEAVAVTRYRLASIAEVTWEKPFVLRTGDTLDLLACGPDEVDSRVREGLGAPHGFDIVVGNPPYVRHERINREDDGPGTAFAEALRRRFPALLREKLGRSDLYAWFFPLAALLLRPGGHVGYVISDSWLDSENGEWLRAFLTSELHARIVLQDPLRRSFSQAGVSTVSLVAQRPLPSSETAPPDIAFLLHDAGRTEPAHSFHILSALLPGPSPEPDMQASFSCTPRARWGTYLRTTLVIADLLGTQRLVPFGRLARLAYGSKPGIREFFVLRRRDEKNGGIEGGFLVPIVTSARDLITGEVDPDRLSCVAFVCPHALADLEAMPEAAGALAWIRRGETQVTRSGARHTRSGIPWPQARSVRNRPGGWYRFAPRPGLDFLVPCLLGTRFLFPANPGHLPATNQFFHGAFLSPEHRDLGLALLQCTVTWRLVEWFGRRKGLGGLNLYGYDLERLPFPDPAAIPAALSAPIVEAHAALVSRPVLPAADEVGHGNPDHAPPDRVRLDEAVLEALGLPVTFISALYADLAAAVEARVRKGRR